MRVSFGQLELALLALRSSWRRGQQDVEEALLSVHLGAVFYFLEALFADHIDGNFDQIADHGFNVAADVAHLSKFGGLDLEEGRVGEFGETARDLSFADTGGPDHDDVLGHDFVGKVGRQLLAALAIAQRDRHGTLGGLLANDVFVELCDDFARR